MKEWWLAIFANIFVIVGWLVVFYQTRAIKDREEIRALVVFIGETVEDIYHSTTEYFSDESSGHINHQSAEIRSKFVLLSHLLFLVKAMDKKGQISPALVAFRMHATGGLFETTRFKEQNEIPNWKSELAASAYELIFVVERCYFRHVNAKI